MLRFIFHLLIGLFLIICSLQFSLLQLFEFRNEKLKFTLELDISLNIIFLFFSIGLENIKMTDTDSFFIPLSIFEKYDKEFLDKIINNELGIPPMILYLINPEASTKFFWFFCLIIYFNLLEVDHSECSKYQRCNTEKNLQLEHSI